MPDAVPAVDGAAPTATPPTIWDQVLDILRDRINPQTFNTWLRPTSEHMADGRGVVIVSVPSPAFINWIRNNYTTAIKEALATLRLQAITIEFMSSPAASAPSTAAPAPARPPASTLPQPTSATLKRAAGCLKCGAQHAITFRVSSGLLTREHLRVIQNGLAMFLWCIDKQTGPNGLILGGKPVTLAQIAESIPFSQRELSRQLDLLETHEYLTALRRPAGLVLRVNNQKKFGSCRCGGAPP